MMPISIPWAVISDYRTMVYAPVSRNVEAGSTKEEKPNAIMLESAATANLAEAAGASEGEPEIGRTGMEPGRVAQMQADLKANPPQPFDLTRRLRIFTSEFAMARPDESRTIPAMEPVGAWAVAIAVLYAVTDELHQGGVIGRHPSAVDVGIDAAGALIAVAVVRLVLVRRTHRRASP